MNISPLQSKAASPDVPIEQLAGNKSMTDEQKVSEVARQFEAVLLRQILSESQKTVFHSSFSDESTTGGIYRDMVSSQMADSISKSGAVGLSQALTHQLTRQVLPAGHEHAQAAQPNAAPVADATRPTHSQRPVARVMRGDKHIFPTINTAH